MRNPYYYFVPNNNYYQPYYQTRGYSNPSYASPNYKYIDKNINEDLLRPCIISESYCDYFDLEDKAPDFTLEGIISGQPKEVSLSDYLGKWVLLFFYGSDFTFV